MLSSTALVETATVHVALGERSYDILIGEDLLGQTGRFLLDRRRVTHVVALADANVVSHAQRVCQSLAAAGVRVELIEVSPGEQSKSVAQADSLWQDLLRLGADRKSVVAAIGGGVIGDLAGFVAATYGRGVPFLQIPTTLLAQVDSSVGGKVAVNLPHAKNMVGVFWQPLGVLIDTATLATLPDRECRSGLAEVVKYGVILDADFFAYLESNVEAICRRLPDVLRHIIARSCRLKADIVEQDEREETGVRAALNYGHTFAHALEATAGYGELLHGEAVSIGMMCAARLALALGRIDEELVTRQRNLLVGLGLPVETPPLDRQTLVNAMRHDKKVEHGRLAFVLPDRLGHVERVHDISFDLAKAAL